MLQSQAAHPGRLHICQAWKAFSHFSNFIIINTITCVVTCLNEWIVKWQRCVVKYTEVGFYKNQYLYLYWHKLINITSLAWCGKHVHVNEYMCPQITALIILHVAIVSYCSCLRRQWYHSKPVEQGDKCVTFVTHNPKEIIREYACVSQCLHKDDWVQENSIGNALELHLSCTNPSIWGIFFTYSPKFKSIYASTLSISHIWSTSLPTMYIMWLTPIIHSKNNPYISHFTVVWYLLICSISFRVALLHWGNHMIVPVPVLQPWRTCLNLMCRLKKKSL